MKVSIITPAYNIAPLIEKCILSVKNQTYKDIEHVIVNDGSKDNTFETAKKFEKEYNLKLLTQENKGIAISMTRGFKESTGEIFAWIDADNYYNLDIVEKIVDIFKKNPKIDVVYGNVDVVDEKGKIINTYRPPKEISFEKALIYSIGAIPVQPAVFFKKEVFEKIGEFDSKYKIAVDYDFWLKVLKNRPNIYYYNVSFGNYLRDKKAISQSLKGITKGYKEMVDICSKYNQTLYGKVMMFIKYFRGYIRALIKI